MHVKPSSPSISDVDERAQRAVVAFRKMQHSLAVYARAVTGNSNVRVEVSSGPPRTDGNVIYYRPPIALGDKTPHDRSLCDLRDETGLRSCAACRIREEILVNIYHEIAHIAFGSFAEGRNWMLKARRHNPFLPFLFNAMEDSRVDSSMFRARRGTRKMLEADVFNLLTYGIPDGRGELHKTSESPLNAQVSLGLYLEAAGYEGWGKHMHEKISTDLQDERMQEIVTKLRDAREPDDVYNLSVIALERLRELGYFMSPEEQEQQESNTNEEEEENDEQQPEAEQEADSDTPDVGPGEGAGDPSEEGDGSEKPEPEADGGVQSPDSSGGDVPDGEGEGAPGERDEDSGHDQGSEADEVGEPDDGGVSAGDEARREDAAAGEDAGSGGGDEGSDSAESTGQEDGPVDADSDGVSEEPGAGGPDDGTDEESDGEGSGLGGQDDQDDEGSDGDSKQAEQGGGSGGDSEGQGSDLGEGDTEYPGPESSEDGDDDAEPDDGSGTRQDGGGSDSREGYDSSDESDDASEGDSGGDEESDAEGDRPEVMESGADQGRGGIDLTEPLPPQGDEDDVEAALDHTHGEVEQVQESASETQAISTAVIQGAYFETPSFGVVEVHEHQYEVGAMGWDDAGASLSDRKFLGIDCDMQPSEAVMGPVLLKTRRIFSDNKTTGYQPNLRSGRVNAKVLGRRAWNDDDRLFGKKRIPAKQDYAVQIMMDISSSNLGDNLALLKQSVMAQAELLHRVGVKFSIVAHSATIATKGRYEGPGFAMHLHHIKSWDQPWSTSTKKALEDVVAVGGNLDGHAMEYGRKQLAKVTATDKVMLYFTDGKMPAANKDEELVVLQRQIKLCKRDAITLLGVGIRTDSPTRHGLETVQVDTSEDLSAVIQQLGKRLAQSGR